MPLIASGQPKAAGVEADGWRAAAAAVIPIWLTVRIAVAVLELIALWTRNGPPLTDRAGARVPDNAGDGFFAVLHHWDSGYFLGIAADGYFGAGAFPGLPAFFPGYPLAARVLSGIFTLGSPTTPAIVASMWLISALASLAGAIVLWRLVRHLVPRAATVSTVLFLAGPYSIFLFAGYSESLFIAFALAAWYCGMRERWWHAGLWGGLASFSRINGVFLLAGLVVMYVIQRRRAGRAVLSRTASWVLPAGSGVAIYFGYLAIRTGDLLAWNTAQVQGWHRALHWPWEAFYQTAGRVLLASTPDRRLQFALDIVAAGLITLAVVTWIRRHEWPAATYAGLTLIALTTSFTFVSLARNSLTVFPLVILLGTTLIDSRRWVRIGVLAGWVGLFAGNGVLFALGYWAD